MSSSGTPNNTNNNKRPSNDEGGNGLSATKYPHEDSTSFPGGARATSSPSHPPYDAAAPKFPRTTDAADRRFPWPPFRVSFPSNDANPDHPEPTKLDFLGDTKFAYPPPPPPDFKLESRDSQQGAKPVDGRADVSKEGAAADFKMLDKDAGGGGSSAHSSWRDSKEPFRGKRYSDAYGPNNADAWPASRSSPHVSTEGGKDAANIEEKDNAETREAVGENKVDLRGEDKFKDNKDRKRREGKHREWGEREKDRSDRRNSSLQLCSNSNSDNKDLIKDEREAERWEKEKKDLSKDKEKVKDRDKDYTKKEPVSGTERDGLHSDMDLTDAPGRAVEMESSTTEYKKSKDADGCKIGEKDPKDKKRDRDMDAEGERLDKRSRHQDKESDEGYGDGEASTEKEREGFSYGLQQRKRMHRPRGSPLTNRDPAFRSRYNDNDGSQGKSDVSAVVYRVGECMQELMKLWMEYDSSEGDRMSESSLSGPTLDIRIPAEHVSATNRQVRGGQLWGTDVYTDDSDLVAVLMHTGYCRPTASHPPATIQELRTTIRVLPPQDSYISTLRNNVRSRAWGSGIGCSYRVERCCIVKKEGGTISLEPCLTHSSTLEPTLAPVAVERTMTTRAAASNALRQQRFVREVTIQFNLCCEPWLKYSISVVADKGLKKVLYTSSRLKKGEVLYVETHSCRYELCFNGERIAKASTTSQAHDSEVDKTQPHYSHASNGERGAVDGENTVIDVFRWSRCKKALPQGMMKSIGIPLPLEHVEVLEENLEWEEIRWSSTGVHISGKEYPLARAHFLDPN